MNKLLILKNFWYLYDKYGLNKAMEYLQKINYNDDINNLFENLNL